MRRAYCGLLTLHSDFIACKRGFLASMNAKRIVPRIF